MTIGAVAAVIGLVFAAESVAQSVEKTGSSAIHGSVKDSSGQPVAGVEVSIHNVDEQSDPAVLSASDGSFALRKIKPGKYEVSAAHDGFRNTAISFDLAAGEDRPVELTLTAAGSPAVTPPVTNVAPVGFWKRFIQAYKDDWHPSPALTTPAPGAEPPYRGYPPVVIHQPRRGSRPACSG